MRTARAGVCDQTSVHTEAGTQHFAVIITEKAPSPFLKHLNFVDTFTSVWGSVAGVSGVSGDTGLAASQQPAPVMRLSAAS